MRRYCGRPGCSANAAVTFTFDATERVVWLDDIADGAARAGDLCTRHADALVPPQGWTRVDHRNPPPVVPVDLAGSVPNAGTNAGTSTPGAASAPTPTSATAAALGADELLPHREPKRKRRRSQRWSDVPSLFDPPAPPSPTEPPILELVGNEPAAIADAPTEPATTELATPYEPEAADEPIVTPAAFARSPMIAIELDDAAAEAPVVPIGPMIDATDDEVIDPYTDTVVHDDTDTVVHDDTDEPTPAWEPRFDVDDLGGLLDAKSPLLSRAFRAAKTSDDEDDEPDDDDVF